MKFTDGKGVNFAIDSGGKDTLSKTILSLSNLGRVVLVGTTSGEPHINLWAYGIDKHHYTIMLFDIPVFEVHIKRYKI